MYCIEINYPNVLAAALAVVVTKASLNLSNEEDEDGTGECESVGLVVDKQKEERIRTSKIKVQDYLNELENAAKPS